jgi:hypothetical protein
MHLHIHIHLYNFTNGSEYATTLIVNSFYEMRL